VVARDQRRTRDALDRGDELLRLAAIARFLGRVRDDRFGRLGRQQAARIDDDRFGAFRRRRLASWAGPGTTAQGDSPESQQAEHDQVT
jgi:hypothetical protein